VRLHAGQAHPHTPFDIVMADPIGWNLQRHPFKAHAQTGSGCSGPPCRPLRGYENKEGLNKSVLDLSARRQSGTCPDWLTPNQMLTHLIRGATFHELPTQPTKTVDSEE